VSELR